MVAETAPPHGLTGSRRPAASFARPSGCRCVSSHPVQPGYTGAASGSHSHFGGPLVAVLTAASLHSKHVPFIMAQTQKRQASTLTLVRQRRQAEALILRALPANSPANSPASLVAGLAAPLADRLAAPGASATVSLGLPLSI